jgi:hypothetical protein
MAPASSEQKNIHLYSHETQFQMLWDDEDLEVIQFRLQTHEFCPVGATETSLTGTEF